MDNQKELDGMPIMSQATKDIILVNDIIWKLSTDMLIMAIAMMESELRTRSDDTKELKDDEMRAEAQADGEQYERELDEANQL